MAGLLAALFLLWQGWTAGRNSLSDVYARPAIDYLEARIASETAVSEPEWQAVYDSISRADELMPGNPLYLDSLGRLAQMQVGLRADVLDIDEVDAYARAAEGYFRSALAARPTWPYYWGSIAQEEYRRGDFGADEYSLALANAARFGPWQKDTQRLVADLGGDTLEFLSPQARREFLLGLERGLSRQSAAMFEVVGDWESICGAADVADDSMPLISSHCEQVTDQLPP